MKTELNAIAFKAPTHRGLVLYTSNDIIEEPDAVIPHVRICVGAVR